LEKLGDTFEKANLFHEAEERFRSSLEKRQQLVERNPNDSRREQDLSSGLDRLGNISTKQKNFDQALTYYRESLDIREKFAERYPQDTIWRTYRAFSYEHIGDVFYEQRKLSEALLEFRKAFDIRRELADAFQKDAERQARVAHLCLSIAQALDTSKKSEKEEAIRLVARGQEILGTLFNENQLAAPQQEDLTELQRLSAELTKQETATTQ
jgi:tetratricopeptide (TPR) repeat protein